MLASYYHLFKQNTDCDNAKNSNSFKSRQQDEAQQLLQAMLDNIESRLESLLEQMQSQHLQDLRVMKQYMDSQS